MFKMITFSVEVSTRSLMIQWCSIFLKENSFRKKTLNIWMCEEPPPRILRTVSDHFICPVINTKIVSVQQCDSVCSPQKQHFDKWFPLNSLNTNAESQIVSCCSYGSYRQNTFIFSSYWISTNLVSFFAWQINPPSQKCIIMVSNWLLWPVFVIIYQPLTVIS